MTQRVVNYTYGTGNPVLPDGSIDVRDGIDNLQSLDILMNAPEGTYNQRDGGVVKTVHGMISEFNQQLNQQESEFETQILEQQSEFNQHIAGMAFTRVGAFSSGGTLDDTREVLLWDVADGGDGHEYGWSGAFPKSVPPSSTPLSTGGVGSGAWVDRSDVTLRSDLSTSGGAELVYWSHLNGLSVSMTVASRLRKKVYASDYGVTELTTPEFNRQVLQAVIDDTATAGAAAVFDVSCSISGMLVTKPNLALFTPRYVTIKVADGVDSGVMQGSSPDLKNIYIEGGTFDGNQQNAPRLAARSVFDFGIVDGFVIDSVTVKNGSGYGFAFQAREHTGAILAYRGHAANLVIRNSKSQNNGVGIAAGGDTYDGFDFKYVDGCIIDNCLASGNSDAGFDIRGYRSFFNNCQATSNGGRGFAFGASYSDTGYPIKGSVWVNNLLADGNALSGFFFGEGLTANAVRYSVNGQGLFAIGNAGHAFRVEAQNADIVVSGLELRGSPTAFYVTQTGVSSLNVSQLLVRDCSGIGIVVDPTVVGPIQLSNIDVLAGTYGASLYSPTQVIFNGGRLTGVANGPIRVDATAAIPVLNGIVDGVITYKKGDVVSNSSPTLTLKLGLDKVLVSSTAAINNISPMIEGREVAIVASGSLTFQNSSAMQVQASPVTITDGNLIKFVAINGKWRQL